MQKFDKIKYVEKYNKENYRKVSVYLSNDEFEQFDNYCKQKKTSKNNILVDFIKKLLKK